MSKKIIGFAAVLGAVAVIFGAYGAHGLKAVLSEAQLATFETGVRYQMYHALMLLFVGSSTLFSDKIKKSVALLVGLGILLFSGSIYLLATNGLTAMDFKILGPVTPLGGLLLILAWIIVAYQGFFYKPNIK